MTPTHDPSYKQIFSHPQMVRDLLRGFVKEVWVEDLDYDSLERVSGQYVSDDLRDREDDIVWRIRQRGEWIYIYLLLEFQSSIDRHMAVRLMTYLGLLYQDLIKARQLTPAGKLPPVLPIVLYNGQPRWSAAEDIAELIETLPGGLARYRPSLRYLLIDEGAVTEPDLPADPNLVAALIRLENSGVPEDVGRIVRLLVRWLGSPEQASLRRALTVWLARVFLPGRLPGVELQSINDLHEIDTMLAERVKEWTRTWMDEGLQKGRQEGRQEGEARLLLRQIVHRFGPVDDAVRQRIESATFEQLEAWADNIFDARCIDDVFGGH